SRGAGKPRINDFTTDPADPPALAHAATLPPNVARDMSYPKAFADIQRGCCADLHPARVRAGAPEAFARAEDVARQMGLTVTWRDPSAGLMEAMATSRLFGFHDDIAIRVRPEADGTSRIDVRSKSRDGQGDLGVNAARIRTFVAALEAGAATRRPRRTRVSSSATSTGPWSRPPPASRPSTASAGPSRIWTPRIRRSRSRSCGTTSTPTGRTATTACRRS